MGYKSVNFIYFEFDSFQQNNYLKVRYPIKTQINVFTYLKCYLFCLF